MLGSTNLQKLRPPKKRLFEHFPVITLTGPRQSGKTTLCRKLYPDLPYINLENANTLQEIQDDIKSFFDKYSQGVIIDEAHNFPEIFSYIQIHVDEDKFKGKKD